MIPSLADRYLPGKRLGGGGYAQAYLSESGREAIKIFNDPHYANTFEGEVKTMQALDGCPGTPSLLDFGRNKDGKLCIVSEFSPGIRLDKLVTDVGPLTPVQAEEMLGQLLEILAWAHERGVVHKDIKASNLLVEQNRYTLLDWGCAGSLADGGEEVIRAKQDFVAPECYYGRHGRATDFYSLAWLVIQALSGKLPYHFATVSDPDYRVAAHSLERPEIACELPGPLKNLLLNWLSKNPEQRLVGYDLPDLLARAAAHQADFANSLEFRQIQREFSFLQRAARHGVPYAQYHLALRLLKEDGREQEAHYWLEAAHAAGFSRATYRLAKFLAQRGEEQSERVNLLFEEAANAGYPKALYRLASRELRHKRGTARIKDKDKDKEAVARLRRAAESGHAASQYRLGKWLRKNGEPEEAARFLAMADDRGYLLNDYTNP